MHKFVLQAVLFLILFSIVISHSFLLVPRGDFVSFRKPECRLGGPAHAPNDTCLGPCISEDRWQFDKNARTTTFRRGQNVTIVWPRNNHEGGFVRFALVPRSDRMNHDAHARMVFHYACFESDRVPCDYSYCGTDSKKTVFQTSVIIPPIYPDGLYVLGWAWFGGIINSESFFGDYWSCSFIRIRGGAPVQQNYQPVFIPGKKNKGAGGVGTSTCRSAVNNVGICVREPCPGRKPAFTSPSSFESGHVPSPISAYWLTSPGPVPSVKLSATPSAKHSFSLAISPTTEMSSPALAPTPSALVSPVPSLSPDSSPNYPIPSALPFAPSASSSKGNPSSSNAAYLPATITPTENQDEHTGEEENNGDIKKVNVSAVRLVDIESNVTLATGTMGTILLSKEQLKRITFIAETAGHTSSVKFFIDDRYVRTESRAPYSCFGDKHGKMNPWPKPILNKWVSLVVRAYSPDNFMNPQHIWFRLLCKE